MSVEFQNLKKDLSRSLVIAFPDLEVNFIVKSDASSKAIWSLIAHKGDDGKVSPIRVASRKMKDAE